MRMATLLLLLGCNHLDESTDAMEAPDAAVGQFNVCAPSPESCEVGLVCPEGQYCYVPWNEISMCGAGPNDGGGTPFCLGPRCSPVVPIGCFLHDGAVQCNCL